MSKSKQTLIGHYFEGTNATWYEGWELSDEEREVFRQRSKASHSAKLKALNGEGPQPLHPINVPKLNPEELMPQLPNNGLRALSLFSGGGGLDLGFDRAGFTHSASFEILRDAACTLKMNRPEWRIYTDEEGNVRNVDWHSFRGEVDVIHGGPPCQPFSMAGRQKGEEDERNLFPEFIRAVQGIKPLGFVAENVKALGSRKFQEYVQNEILEPLQKDYNVTVFQLSADSFGVPQQRQRLFFVGTDKKRVKKQFLPPDPTHSSEHLRLKQKQENQQMSLFDLEVQNESILRCMGVREALGLSDIGFDAIAPTLRSGLTGPRHTTSILSSTAALKIWDKMQVWPNGVGASRENANKFVTKNGHFRLSVQDCAILQGFPSTWSFHGAVYMILGQIGNSVAPPMAYRVAEALAKTLI